MKLRDAIIFFFGAIFISFSISHIYEYTQYHKIFFKQTSLRVSAFISDLDNYISTKGIDDNIGDVQNILDKMAASRPIIESISYSIDGEIIDYSSNRPLRGTKITSEYIDPHGSIYEELNDGKFAFYYPMRVYKGATLHHGKLLVKLNEELVLGDIRRLSREIANMELTINAFLLLLLGAPLYFFGIRPLYKTIQVAENKGGKQERYFIKDIDKLNTTMINSFALLEEQKQLYTSIVELAEEGIVLLDPESMRFVNFNNAACQTLGYTREEFAALSLLDLQSDDFNPEAAKELMDKLVEKGGLAFGHKHKCKDGSERYIIASNKVIEVNDKKYISAVWHDVTEQRMLQDELEETNCMLEIKVSEEAEKRVLAERAMFNQSKLAMMGEVMEMVAHHWRQPLNALAIAVQDIPYAYEANEVDAAYIKDIVDTSMRQVRFMSKTIDDFKGFFAPHKNEELFCIEDAIESVLNMAIAGLEEAGIEVKVVKSGKHSTVGYPSDFKQVMLNIFSNAKDAIVANGTEQKLLEIQTGSDGEFVTITIEDSGGGIPDNVMGRMFEPYFSTKGQGKGVGIGLYMSRQVIERHMGGKMDVDNGELGARFTIKLRVD